MALQASSFPSSSSSSSFRYEWPYDVFLSFRGRDTRHGFTRNLYKALSDKGIHTFFDDQELLGGEEITPAHVKAIQDSGIAIVVFSVNYASYSFCLQELATIMECVKGKGRLVFPVFYNLDPSHVRHQRGSYGGAMNKLEERSKDDKEKVHRWREALRHAANLSGTHFRAGYEFEYAFIHKTVEEIPNTIMPKQEYDVFMSFRGKDTHATFSSLLHTSLEKAGISVFKDDDDDAHRRGEQMSIQQLNAIRLSRFCVIVFSRNYAGSKWCLLELENIIDCHKTKSQVVVPVFYDVDPADVRNETGVIWEAFQDLVNRISAEEDNKVQRWKDALREAGGILGFVVEDYSRNRGEDIKKVVECVTRWVNRTNLPVATHPVGVQDGVQFLVKQLNKQKSDDVLLLGIWGMGGIGKTTFAKALYNQIGCEFEGSSFLLDIRNAWQRERHASLQERILSDIFLTRQRTIPDIESGKRRLEQGLHDKKVLLLLDGVNKMEQLDPLCGSRKWFGPGSIIIITTRDKRLLIDHRVDLVYTMNEMDESESTELFSWHAFRQASPRQDFAELCGNVVSYCGGLPLALSVLGSELFGKEMTEWKNVLDRLREVPHPYVQDVLRISFDDLNDDRERDLFLDISFFYIGINKDDVMHALKCYGGFLNDGITVLEDRSLVKVDENGKFGMHVLLREMGREILRELFRIEPGPMIYDVFLSFCADTRASFTSHLYTYLQNAGCHVFKDDESLQRGDQISISMMQAIGRSRISVVVLSEKYPNSRWCMIELEKILECSRTTNQQVLPVFYGVKPSEVRNSGVPFEDCSRFREAFEELLGNVSVDKDRVPGWRAALAGIGAIQGHVIANSWNESKDIKKVVEDITRMLNRKYLHVAEHPVGVESRVDDVIQLLDNHQEKDVLVLGIWGMGGAGKTTIAKATYNRIGDKFEGRSFLLDVRKVWKETNGPVSLQKQVLSDVYEEMEIKIDNIEEKKNVLQEKLRQKKILLVLDNVNDQEQLNALCGSYDWFREESRIIITTRDKKLLAGVRKGDEKLQARVREVGFEIYPLEKMEERESIELFSWHAFQQAIPIEGFHELSGNIVSYSGGLPLALEVLGSYLLGRGLEDWTSVLNRLKRIPNDIVQEKLKISYDGLNHEEKDIFLDIACFFIGMDRNDVIRILDGCGFSATTSRINVLEERSLVTVDKDNKLGMHNLLRDMGREIVRQQSPKEPRKWSRLWDSNDVLDVLQNKARKGTGNIKGLALKLSKIKKIKLSAFEMMNKLRLLQLDGVELDGNFENMSRDLRWLYWRRFPSSHTPAEFDQGKLVAIELEHSMLKLMWEETKMLDKLKVLNLSHSHHLTKTPDFSYLPNLEKLSLEDCLKLFYVSSTIGRLKKLKIINLKDCKNLRELPCRIYKLTSLQTLILSGCKKINKLEEHLEQMKSLTTLEADGTGIGQMPCALIRSKSIGKISWCNWKGISRNVFPSMIIWSWTSPTNNVSSQMRGSTGLWSCVVSLIVPKSSFQGLFCIVSELPRLRSLRLECSSQFQISGDEALDTLNAELEPTTTTLLASNVNASAFVDSRSQGDIFRSKYSLNFLLIQMGMESPVTKIPRESIFQKMRNCGPGDFLLPGDKNPHWLTFSGEGFSVIFEVPRLTGRNLKTVMLCIVYSSPDIVTSEDLFPKNVLIINHTKGTTHVYQGDMLISLKDEVWQSIISNLEPGDKVQVVVVLGRGFIVKKTAIYLVYDEPIDQNMEHFYADVFVSDNDTVSGFDDMPTNREHIQKIGTSVLVDRSLVTVGEENKLRAHDLIQPAKREIVRERSQIKPEPRTYDVFLSFRGEDTHAIFTQRLHMSLENAGFYVFKDDDALPREEQIELSLPEAIGDSRISVIVLSTNYADSRWCLQELENIMECYRAKTHMVLPIFYSVEPSEVRNQTGKFGQAFEKLIKRIAVVKEDKVLSWRTTLREVGSLSGIVVPNSRNQSEAIDDIVEHITSLLHSKDLIVPEYLVGVQSHVQVLAQLLKDEKPDHVLLLGIWGMAGIGKTTIAKALYNEVSQNFEGRKFIPDIRDEWTDDRKTSLQEQLLSSVDETNSTVIHSTELGKLILRDRLSLKRLFLVLDDVTNLDQLEALCGNREWFGPGSRIIITTRDKNLLNVLKVDHVYRVNEMNYSESAELFSWHAFKKATPESYFAGLVKHVVEYCGGLPLALAVLGSFLRENGKSIEEWESALEKFTSEPQQELQKKLKTSFDDISDDKMKNILLDIACFLVGLDQEDVTQILYGSGYKAETGIRVLEEKCLVTVGEKNNLQMHGLLQQMGREIAREASQIMPKLEYDVFLSFRGKDTHATFSSLLHTSLEKAGISVFKDVDDNAHRRGEQMSIQQLKAIRMSRFCVIVFSRNYANSKWCLLELENIIDCHKTKRQVVVPVFYDVDPEDVRNETGMIWEAFQDLVNRTSAEEDKLRSWRDALREAGGILGFVVKDYSRNRGEDIKKVAECVTRWVNKPNLFVATHPVGIQDGVQFLVKHLNKQKSDDVLLLGIWGMGGIGKTTFAKALYNQIGCEFDGSSFLLDIRKAWQRARHTSLQERILSDIFLTRQRTIPDIESGKRRLEQELHDKKVLLLLDGVNKMEQLDALCGSRKWFGPGRF